MTEFTRRALGAALLSAFAAIPALGQEVQVLSHGAPYAISDEINASFAPARDERKSKRPLSARSDASTIANAYLDAFLRCGVNEANYPSNQAPGAAEAETVIENGTYIPIAGTHKLLLLGEFMRGKAIYDIDKRKVLTPQCPAGVRSMYWSYSTDRAAFAVQAVTGVSFAGDARSLWTARLGDGQDIYFINTRAQGAKFRKVFSLPDEKVLDVLLPDNTDHFWVLSQSERISLPNPNRLVHAAAGAQTPTIDINLRKVDLKGNVLETTEVARAVPEGTAHFVRE
ncbi:MAG: hypothetical protein ACJ8GW_02785 [Massilia sp.]